MSAFDHFHADPTHWKLGIFYFCRADPRILVPKRIRGLGWTLNFARPLAVPFLIYLIATLHGVLELVGALGSGADPSHAIKLLVALAIIGGAYQLLVRTRSKPIERA